MTDARKKKLAFRPNLGEGPLEVRVVPATLLTTQVVRTHDILMQSMALNNLNNALAGPRLRNTFDKLFRSAEADARAAIRTQAAQLYANGTPTAQQKADFAASVNGIVAATALRLSSLVSLLPNGSNLVPGIQQALMGSQRNSLVSRVDQALQSNRISSSLGTLNRTLSRDLTLVTNRQVATFNRYVANNNPARQAVDANGQSIPIGTYVGGQLINQLGNTLGSLAQSFPTVAGSMLFSGGATTASPAALQAFAQQYSQALGLTAFSLGNGLSLFPGLTSGLVTQLQTGLFGTGANGTSLLSALQGLPTTSSGFNTAASTAFSNAFQSLTSPISSFFNLPSSQTFTLPTSNIPGLFGSSFSNFGNGFLTGFGSGFPGFGTFSGTGSLTGTGTGTGTNLFNPAFGTGFNTLISGLNTGFGFNVPILDGTGSLTGTGPGTGGTTTTGGTGTTTGTGGLTGTGTGTGTTGTTTGGTGILGGSGTGLRG